MPGEELLGLNEWNYSFSFLPAKDVSANILYARSESLLPQHADAGRRTSWTETYPEHW